MSYWNDLEKYKDHKKSEAIEFELSPDNPYVDELGMQFMDEGDAVKITYEMTQRKEVIFSFEELKQLAAFDLNGLYEEREGVNFLDEIKKKMDCERMGDYNIRNYDERSEVLNEKLFHTTFFLTPSY